MKKILQIMKAFIFITTFMALVGTFFNYKVQFEEGILAQMYGDKTMNIMGMVLLLVGWIIWEFAVGKRKSSNLGIVAAMFFMGAAGLVGHLLTFVGLGLTLALMLFVMIQEFNRPYINVRKLANIFTFKKIKHVKK